jgi:EAL domain-containing protein (putative c-di-GMP-specific phosphodiesterase class I)
MVTNMTRANLLIDDIGQRGCKFYLDDFGSGYASYSYLKDLPVDVIKIDGIFIKDILEEKSSYAMVKSITEIAHYMEKKVIAEYVENEAIMVTLRELDVDFAQGYGVGRPLALQKLIQPSY